MSRRLPLRLLSACLAGALGATLTAAPATGAVAREGSRPHERATSAPATASERDQAEDSLAQAKALFSAPSAAPRHRKATGGRSGRDATMIMTDLAHRLDDLSATDRRVARALLARPTFGQRPAGYWEHSYTVPEQEPVCAEVCVHYVTSSVIGKGNDAVSTADGNGDGVPDYVHRVAATMRHVWSREVDDLGYRAPRSDLSIADHGPGAQLDVFLQDLPTGFYGYCAPDTDARTTSAYCVLDNDYSKREFPAQTPIRNLQVTAAHEFFHAVQYAYDSEEDLWLLEGTATWIEDEVYDAVNDNRQFLAQSPLSDPSVPLDYSDESYGPYGSWVFWKFLSERAGRGTSDDPAVVRKVWAAAIGSRYSTAALQRVLRARHDSFARAFGAFGTWASSPARYFSEGARYPRAPLDDRFTLTPAHRSSGLQALPVSHMSQSFIRFTPGRSLRGVWRLRVAVNLADTRRGSEARVVVRKRSGGASVRTIALNRSGNGSRVVAFRRSAVSFVELDMANASIRFRCGFHTVMSCGGRPSDDDLPAKYRATALR